MKRWKFFVGAAVLVLVIGAGGLYLKSAADAGPVVVDQAERDEVILYERAIQERVALRNQFIAYLARRYKVDLRTYNYDVENGQFVPRPPEPVKVQPK